MQDLGVRSFKSFIAALVVVVVAIGDGGGGWCCGGGRVILFRFKAVLYWSGVSLCVCVGGEALVGVFWWVSG